MFNKSDRSVNNDTETLILQAAEKEFMKKGFSGARTTSIATAAGVTHAMLHYYFRTKEKLFDRIITEKFFLLKNALFGSFTHKDAPLEEIINNIICSHLDFIAANPDLPRFIVGEIFCNPERTVAFVDSLKKNVPSFISFVQEKINNGVKAGICRNVDAKMLMLDIVSLNIFPYMAAPAVNAALSGCMDKPEEFLAQRKKENFETIMRKISLNY